MPNTEFFRSIHVWLLLVQRDQMATDRIPCRICALSPCLVRGVYKVTALKSTVDGGFAGEVPSNQTRLSTSATLKHKTPTIQRRRQPRPISHSTL